MTKQTFRKPAIAVTPEQYKTLAQQYTPKQTVLKNSAMAFLVGGLICAIGQMLVNLFTQIGYSSAEASTASSATIIFMGALLTGLGVYDEIGKISGAGSIIPVSGFANSIVAPAMEFQREGYVLGVGARLFTVAGPVLVYGIATSIVVGIIYFLAH